MNACRWYHGPLGVIRLPVVAYFRYPLRLRLWDWLHGRGSTSAMARVLQGA